MDVILWYCYVVCVVKLTLTIVQNPQKLCNISKKVPVDKVFSFIHAKPHKTSFKDRSHKPQRTCPKTRIGPWDDIWNDRLIRTCQTIQLWIYCLFLQLDKSCFGFSKSPVNGFWPMVQFVGVVPLGWWCCKGRGILAENKDLTVWQGNLFFFIWPQCGLGVFSLRLAWSLCSLMEWNNAEHAHTHMHTHTSLNWTCTPLLMDPLFSWNVIELCAVGVAWMRGQSSEVGGIRWSSWLYAGAAALDVRNEWVGRKASEAEKVKDQMIGRSNELCANIQFWSVFPLSSPASPAFLCTHVRIRANSTDLRNVLKCVEHLPHKCIESV